MKNAYIHDGSGWQSLKGPPGPSEPSADAGNELLLGSDGLLFLRDAAASEGVFTPTFVLSANTSGDDDEYVGQIIPPAPSEILQECYWSRTGRLVTVTVRCSVGAGPGVEVDRLLIGGLPFAIADTYLSEYSYGESALSPPRYYAMVFNGDAMVKAIKAVGVAFAQPYTSTDYGQDVGQVIEVTLDLAAENAVVGWFSLNYETNDPPVSRGT